MGSGMTSWIKLSYTTEQTPGRVSGTHSRQKVWKITLSEYRDFLIKDNTSSALHPHSNFSSSCLTETLENEIKYSVKKTKSTGNM